MPERGIVLRRRQYIDELLMVRVMDKGDFYVHQGERSERERVATGKASTDARVRPARRPGGSEHEVSDWRANWNVIALTNLRGNGGGAVVERYVYTPYGEVNVMQGERDQGGSVSAFADRDGDEDVDSTDKGTVGTTCNSTPVTGECRILDLDFDGDYDATDAGFFDYLPQGVGRHPGKFASGVDQPFHHQGLLFEPEVRQYQNRARQYDPGKHRFVQRDPLGRRVRARGVYRDGLHLAEYLGSAPYAYVDPMGTKFSLGGFLSWLGAVITQLPIFIGETVVGIATGHELEGGMNYGNYCGPNQDCFGFRSGASGSPCLTSGGSVGCPSFDPGCGNNGCPAVQHAALGLDTCCRDHDGCYCRPVESELPAGCVPFSYVTYRPSDCDNFFHPTDRTRACDGILCDCMDGLSLPFGSTAWNQREQMRIVFGCFFD